MLESHYSSRRGVQPTVVVLHLSGSWLEPDRLLRTYARQGTSSHFAIGRLGIVRQFVPLSARAWSDGGGLFPSDEALDTAVRVQRRLRHEGRSERDAYLMSGVAGLEQYKRPDLNSRSISIEIANLGRLGSGSLARLDPRRVFTGAHRNTRGRSQKWECFSPETTMALSGLIRAITNEVPSARWITGHEDVINDRHGHRETKLGPGPAFEDIMDDIDFHGLSYVRYHFPNRKFLVGLK